MANTIRIDKALSQVAIDYQNLMLVGAMGKVFPIVTVNQDTGYYYTFGKEQFKVAQSKWAAGMPAAEVKPWSSATGTYSCVKHKLSRLVTEDEKTQADDVIMPLARTTKSLVAMINGELDIAVAAKAFDASTSFVSYTSALSGTTQWSDYTNSDPIAAFQAAIDSVRANAGVRANKAVMGKAVYDKLVNHPDIVDRIKYTQLGVATEMLLAKVFGLDEIIVGGSIYDSADEGQTSVMADIWGKNCLIYYAPSSPSIMEPSTGYIIMEKLYGGMTARVRRWEDEAREGEMVEAARSWDVKITSAASGYLYTDAVA